MQCVVAVLTLVFGVKALAVGRLVSTESALHKAAWSLSGYVFVALGISSVLQLCIGAPWAYFAGQGSSAYDLYLLLSPIGNHSRGILVVAYGAMMVALVWAARMPRGRFTALALCVTLAAMVLGGLLGWREGSLVRARHYTAMAISDSAELILLFAALLVGVIWNTTDRLLWLALVIFTVHELFDVTMYSALAWGGVPGAWRPSPMYIHLYASVAYAAMITIAVRRARLAGRGVKVSGLLDPPAKPPASLIS